MSMTKDEAINLCIQVLQYNVNVDKIAKLPHTLTTYCNIVNSDMPRFLKRLWKHCVVPCVYDWIHNEYEEPIDDEQKQELENVFSYYGNSDTADKFINNVRCVSYAIFESEDYNRDNDILVKLVIPYIVEYLSQKFVSLQSKEYSGPVCLMRYMYDYLYELDISDTMNIQWTNPQSTMINVLTQSESSSSRCSYCSSENVERAFVLRRSKYTWELYVTCSSCHEFNDIILTNTEQPLIELDTPSDPVGCILKNDLFVVQ